MNKPYKRKPAGGPGRGDGRKPGYKQGGFRTTFQPRFGGGRAELHDAICSKCGDACQVPFRPNGSKPIFCKKCFSKDGASSPKRFGDRERPSFRDRDERPSYGARPAAPTADLSKVEARLAAVEKKLDMIIEALLEADGEEGEDGDTDDEE
jgi:CxxC-x17-CxxC domain-containing protein